MPSFSNSKLTKRYTFENPCWNGSTQTEELPGCGSQEGHWDHARHARLPLIQLVAKACPGSSFYDVWAGSENRPNLQQCGRSTTASAFTIILLFAARKPRDRQSLQQWHKTFSRMSASQKSTPIIS